MTMPHENRFLLTLHLRNRFLTVTSSSVTYALGHWVGGQAVARRFTAHAIRVTDFTDTYTQNHRLRLKWGMTVRHWQSRDWQRVVFTDESCYSLFIVGGRQRVCLQRERTAACCVQEVAQFSGVIYQHDNARPHTANNVIVLQCSHVRQTRPQWKIYGMS